MQRQLRTKLLSLIPRGDPGLISHNPFVSSILKPNTNPLYSFQRPFSCPHLWKSSNISVVSGGVRYGFLFSPFLGRRIFSNALLKGQIKGFASGRRWVPVRRSFHPFSSQYSSWRSFIRRFSSDDVVIGIILANVAVFLLWRVADPRFMMKNFMISVDNFTSGRVHTLITSAFSHQDMWHLIANMIGLYFFGLSVGRNFGSEYLLKLYLSGAIAGSIFYLAYHAYLTQSYQSRRSYIPGYDPSKIPGLGASGAVNAVMLLDIFLFPKKTILLNFIIPVPAVLLGIFMIGKDILRILEGDNQVSGSAHLGGAAVAAVAWNRIKRGHFRRF